MNCGQGLSWKRSNFLVSKTYNLHCFDIRINRTRRLDPNLKTDELLLSFSYIYIRATKNFSLSIFLPLCIVDGTPSLVIETIQIQMTSFPIISIPIDVWIYGDDMKRSWCCSFLYWSLALTIRLSMVNDVNMLNGSAPQIRKKKMFKRGKIGKYLSD